MSIETCDDVLCRACRKTSDETDRMLPLFAKEEHFLEFHTILDLFSKYTFLVVEKSVDDAAMEPSLCIECYEILCDFHKFRKMCMASHLEFERVSERITEYRISPAADDDVAPSTELEAIRHKEDVNVNERYMEIVEIIDSDEDSQSQQPEQMHSYEIRILTNETQLPVSSNTNFEHESNMNVIIAQDSISFNQSPNLNADESTNNKYMCKKCGATRRTEVEIEHHINIHTKETCYVCDFCSFIFYTPSALTHHILGNHIGIQDTDSGMKCCYCDEIFNDVNEVKVHLSTHFGKYECKICNHTYSNMATYKLHMKIQHQQAQTGSGTTSGTQSIGTDSSLEIDLTGPEEDGVAEEEEEKEETDLEFRNDSNNDADNSTAINFHSEPVKRMRYPRFSIFACELCDYKSKRSADVRRHLKTHGYKYECNVCSYRHNTAHGIIAHRRHVHKRIVNAPTKDAENSLDNAGKVPVISENRHFSCDQCTGVFSTQAYLTQHMQFHATDDKFKCIICLKRFTRKYSLQKHLKLHAYKDDVTIVAVDDAELMGALDIEQDQVDNIDDAAYEEMSLDAAADDDDDSMVDEPTITSTITIKTEDGLEIIDSNELSVCSVEKE